LDPECARLSTHQPQHETKALMHLLEDFYFRGVSP
jgi:hypothetical protein